MISFNQIMRRNNCFSDSSVLFHSKDKLLLVIIIVPSTKDVYSRLVVAHKAIFSSIESSSLESSVIPLTCRHLLGTSTRSIRAGYATAIIGRLHIGGRLHGRHCDGHVVLYVRCWAVFSFFLMEDGADGADIVKSLSNERGRSVIGIPLEWVRV